MKKTIDVWYLFHSGFAVKTDKRILVFDYYINQAVNGGPALDNGKFSPEDFRDKDVYFFVSHGHYDHYNPVIFRWAEQNPNIRLIISSDIKGYEQRPNIYSAEPDKKYDIDDMYIETFTSTDEGTAFLVKADGVSLFHAGDLHWWHWEGEPESFNRRMEVQFKEQIGKLSKDGIDIAFVVVDPRQDKFSLLGLDWFVRNVDCAHIFPMHFSEDYSIMDTIRKFIESNMPKPEIHLISSRGQRFHIEI